MCAKDSESQNPAMRSAYDISGGVRGKYDQQYQQGTNIVRLDPDVAAVFRTSESVNEALRMLMNIAKQQIPTPAALSIFIVEALASSLSEFTRQLESGGAQ